MVKKQMPSLHHALNISLIRSEMWKADDSSSNISFPICQNNKPKCMWTRSNLGGGFVPLFPLFTSGPSD